MHPVDPATAEVAQRRQVLVGGQKLRLEPPHLAGGRPLPVDGVAANDPAHGRITRQTVGVVHVVVATKATEHGLAEQPRHAMPSVLAGAAVDQRPACEAAQPEDVVEFPIGEQAAIRGDPGTVGFELDPAVEIDPKSLLFCFTHRVRHGRTSSPASSL